MRGRVFVAIAAAVLLPSAAAAQVVITEIMYDIQSGSDSGREWIEVYNLGTDPVDLTELRLFENGTNHKITAAASAALAPGLYAIIADNAVKFRTDWPQFTGQLFDSTFSLGNGGDSIALRDASSTDISSVSYQSSWGGGGDGNSLDRSPDDTGAFIPRTPSPGASMSSSAVPPPAPKETVATQAKRNTHTSALYEPTDVADAQTSEMPDPVVPDDSALSETAGVAGGSGTPYAWWMGALVLAALAALSIIGAKYFKKREWDIVEE